MMMNSRLFREELERIIETQMKDGAGPSGLLQQISDMMGAQGARFNGNVFKSRSTEFNKLMGNFGSRDFGELFS